VLLYPCLVQGDGAADSICEGIAALNARFPELDVLIVGRGGGSAEDLWAFNEEKVARAVASSAIPVISAVGHEVDTVISDMAADVRAATPTAAAELAVPHIGPYIESVERNSPAALFGILQDRIAQGEEKLHRLRGMCDMAIAAKLRDASHRLEMLRLDIEAADPANQLKRGYAIVKDGAGGRISSAKVLSRGDAITVILADGSVRCLVEEVEAQI
jgi:exodeoxyribonuclease VII large subunit